MPKSRRAALGLLVATILSCVVQLSVTANASYAAPPAPAMVHVAAGVLPAPGMGRWIDLPGAARIVRATAQTSVRLLALWSRVSRLPRLSLARAGRGILASYVDGTEVS